VAKAEIKGNTLTLTEVPLHAKLPMKVTIVAWQYGRNSKLKLQRAKLVPLFYLTK
jgi:hypothetical protein